MHWSCLKLKKQSGERCRETKYRAQGKNPPSQESRETPPINCSTPSLAFLLIDTKLAFTTPEPGVANTWMGAPWQLGSCSRCNQQDLGSSRLGWRWQGAAHPALRPSPAPWDNALILHSPGLRRLCLTGLVLLSTQLKCWSCFKSWK